MENKCLKKSTMQQLQKLVLYMEENPEFAKGIPVFGTNKFSVEEKWKNLCQTLNSHGPPLRTVADWKKTWADLKFRTKKKIAENKESLRETGGGMYRFSYLTELEQVIDRALCLSSAAAPIGRTFGKKVKKSEGQCIDDCFQSLLETPPRTSATIAVVTPNRVMQEIVANEDPKGQPPPTTIAQNNCPIKRPKSHSDSDEELPRSSAKKRKVVNEQLHLIRRQLRVAERNAANSKEQADAVNRLANAAEKMSAAIEAQTACLVRMETILHNLAQK